MSGLHKVPALQVAEDRWDKDPGLVKILNIYLQRAKLHGSI